MAMVSTGTSRWLSVRQCRLGLVDPVAVEERIEVAVAEALVDRLPEPMFRQIELGRKHGDGEAFLPVDALHGHQMVERGATRRVRRHPDRHRHRRGLGALLAASPGRIDRRRSDREDWPAAVKQAPSGQTAKANRPIALGRLPKYAGDAGDAVENDIRSEPAKADEQQR